jgi:predicted O-methyltransferase YrrM
MSDTWLDTALSLAATVPGYFPVPQLVGLARLATTALAHSTGDFLEIGSYCGRSTVVLGALASQHGRRLVTVDRHLGSIEMLPPFPYFDQAIIDRTHHRLDSLWVLMDTLELAGLRDHVTVVVAPSRSLRASLRPGYAMIMIDGGHDPLSAWTDYLTACELLGDEGTLIIDDVFENPAHGGRPPYEIMVAAQHAGFELVDREGPLVALQRR